MKACPFCGLTLPEPKFDELAFDEDGEEAAVWCHRNRYPLLPIGCGATGPWVAVETESLIGGQTAEEEAVTVKAAVSAWDMRLDPRPLGA